MNVRNNGRSTNSVQLKGNSTSIGKVRSVKKLSRLSSAIHSMEPLESRTMMSASALLAPSALSITASSSSSISLAWKSNGINETGYKLLRAKAGGSFGLLTQINSNSILNYTDKTVAPNTTYTYELQAFGGKAVSGVSAKVSAVTPLVAPTGLTANLSGSGMMLKWTDNDKTANSYQILRESDGVHFIALATLNGATVNTYTDATITDGHAYAYEVEATKSGNTSMVSVAAKTLTPLIAPSHLAAAVSSSSQVHLTWTNNDSAATGYKILRSTNGAAYTPIATVTGASTASADDKTAAPFTTYYYEVEATSAAVASAASASATATTPLAVPTWVNPIVIGQNAMQFTWADSDTAAKGYIIWQATGNGGYSQAALINSGKTFTWSDTTFTSDTQYSFEIEAVNGSFTSAASVAVNMTTPLQVVSGLSATANSTTSIQLNWTDNDANATKYAILRSVNGSALLPLTTLTGGSVATYTDSTTLSGHAYVYDVVAEAANSQSGMSDVASVVTPMNAPISVTATATIVSSVVIAWIGQDSSAAGYNILRSSDNVNFTKISSVNGATVGTYTDNSVSSAHTYYYKVQAVDAYATSPISTAATVSTPLLTPTGLIATIAGTNVNLSWTNKDSQATGYLIMRSTDGLNYTQLAQINSGTTLNYADTTAAAGQKYYYQVRATAAGFTSPLSTVVSVAVGTPSNTSSVAITVRYSDELVITSTGADDSIALSESGSSLTIVANGKTTIQPVPAAGVFVYTRGGADGISIASGVTAPTTVETIDTGVDDISSAGTNVTVWDDSSDVFTGTGTVRTVSAFAGGVAKTTGASLANPSDSGATMKVTGSLWGAGPVAGDINQGQAGDCYFLSSLAAFADQQPGMLQQSAVDMGDGTYAVRFMNGATPTYIRVNNSLSTYGGGNYYFARPGSSGNLWGAILEKAYADFRTGANTYSSLDSGWMGSAYALFGVGSNAFFPGNMTSTALYNELSADLASGKEVTLGTNNAPQLVSGHAYTLVSVSMVNGVASYVVRNPWGESGDSLENSQGYATLTFAEMQANFYDGCEST